MGWGGVWSGRWEWGGVREGEVRMGRSKGGKWEWGGVREAEVGMGRSKRRRSGNGEEKER